MAKDKDNKPADLKQQVAELTRQNREMAERLAQLQAAQAAPPAATGGALAIKLTQAMALGNGDRPAGTRLATIQLAEGVEIGEVITAFCNPNRFHVSVVPAG